MAKKKPAKSKKLAAGRKARHKPAKGPAAVVRKKKPPSTSRAADSGPSLGRPKVTGDEDLDMLFKEDFHARQIFKFLDVATVKQLEQLSAGEILRRLSRPIKETVERIRRSLAERNRCLDGDEEFALEHKSHVEP
ncbi:MAG TPA: hypothetical protein VKU82_06330 [Planctomycetaceae bacterium]|nr:hypothetical protein [Planctomycetaceae bacterium]